MIGVLNEITRNGMRLRTIIDKARRGQAAMPELAYFMDISSEKHLRAHDIDLDISSVQPEFTDFIEAYEVDGGTAIHINFAIIMEYPEAKVYEIDSFDHWDILKSPPQLMTYVGKPYVLYDRTHNCRKSVLDNRATLIPERCTRVDYIGTNLDKWQAVPGKQNVSELQAQVKVTKLYNYVY